ncbi:ACP phosphodiesterase [Zooshikella sp. RANM57]|uniref:ACP phosphodiesterase n=1 Tax=Zooshikella sp. RANM57 TaxID=3425863 RepID=UPI003D6EA6EB
MNYLAHTVLSKKDIDYQLGNLLADPLKGKAWAGCSPSHLDGIQMHGWIDSFTDTNQHVRRAKTRLGTKGYLKGVVIDITFDHLLIKHWKHFINTDINKFIHTFHINSLKQLDTLPKQAADFIKRIIAHNVLSSYEDYSGLVSALQRIDHRLSPRILAKETASSYLPLIASNLESIEEDFLLFFPELAHYFIDKSSSTAHERWLK